MSSTNKQPPGVDARTASNAARHAPRYHQAPAPPAVQPRRVRAVRPRQHARVYLPPRKGKAARRSEGRPPTPPCLHAELIPFAELQRLDGMLAGLGRGAGALRLRLGEALEAIAVRGWHHELGFSSVGAYALERCERGPRWAAESRIVARRLAKLPLLRQALTTGTVSWSMAELLARRAAPETERGLLEDSSQLTVRALRARFGEKPLQNEEERERRMLTVTVDQRDGWLFECTSHLVSHLIPGSTQDDVVHALLAEATSTLAERLPAGMLVALAPSQSDETASAAWRAQRAAWCEEAEARCESHIDLSADFNGEPHRSQTNAASSPDVLDQHLRELAAELADKDLLLGTLAERFWRADGWRRLGYASSAQYARERLGLSLSSIKSRRILAARSKHLPALAEAVQSSRIGYEAALILSRIANRQTATAWIARAAERTVKQLREEVQVAELFIRLGRGRSQLPPDEPTMRHIAEARLQATKRLSELAKPQRHDNVASVSQMSADVLESAEASEVRVCVERFDPPVGSERGWGRATLRWGLKPDTLGFWHSMKDVHRRFQSELGGSLIRFLCLSFWEVWGVTFDGSGAYGRIYARDGYRCTNPTCSRRDVTPHHLRFRSHGGGDEPENLTSLCVWCHLEGVHGGRIKARPPAPDIHWQLGRKPILAVRGRKKSNQGMSPSRHSMGGCSGAVASL